jgi:hypothetical protein
MQFRSREASAFDNWLLSTLTESWLDGGDLQEAIQKMAELRLPAQKWSSTVTIWDAPQPNDAIDTELRLQYLVTLRDIRFQIWKLGKLIDRMDKTHRGNPLRLADYVMDQAPDNSLSSITRLDELLPGRLGELFRSAESLREELSQRLGRDGDVEESWHKTAEDAETAVQEGAEAAVQEGAEAAAQEDAEAAAQEDAEAAAEENAETVVEEESFFVEQLRPPLVYLNDRIRDALHTDWLMLPLDYWAVFRVLDDLTEGLDKLSIVLYKLPSWTYQFIRNGMRERQIPISMRGRPSASEEAEEAEE